MRNYFRKLIPAVVLVAVVAFRGFALLPSVPGDEPPVVITSPRLSAIIGNLDS